MIELRKMRRLTRPELAARMGTSTSQVTKLERAERRLTVDWLERIAEALQVSPADLLEHPNSSGPSRVPVLSWVSAGSLVTPDAVITDLDELPMIEVTGLAEGDWIALRVSGDSMDRISPPESIILANRRDRRLVANACYIIGDGDGGATYKRYRPDPMRFEPVSTNPVHEPLFPNQEPTIIGRVRRSVLDM